MVATATRKLVGGRFMAMTTGPDRSMPDAATAATGVITACTGAVLPGIPEPRRRPHWRIPTGQSLPRRMPAPALGDKLPAALQRRPGVHPSVPQCALDRPQCVSRRKPMSS